MNGVKSRLLRQLSEPKWSPLGWIVKHFLQQNFLIEQAAVSLAALEPHHQLHVAAMSAVKTRLLRQLSEPRWSPLGWIVKCLFERKNIILEQAAVRLAVLEPHHQVLELGFGPGIGLKDAQAKLGPHGRLYGVDPSEYMHSVASRRLASGIQTGQVQLFHGTAESLPLPDGTIDRVFHCNCYYFWSDLDKTCNEIKRVMKPGAFMVTTLSISVLQMLEEYGIFEEVKWQPQPYMEALQRAHFSDVNMKSFQQGSLKYEAIFAAVH